MFRSRKTTGMVLPEDALSGRARPIPTAETHFVNGRRLADAPPEGMRAMTVGMGCFWGVERIFWQVPGVWLTAAGYAGGYTPNPTYEEVCGGKTGHAEVVRLVFDPDIVSYDTLLGIFWENHDPTQGLRQGNDIGSQYRSALYVYGAEQRAAADASCRAYQNALHAAGHGAITTEIRDAPEFYFAEDYHQQYLARNPAGYCGIGGTGVACPLGVGVLTGH